MWKKQCWCTRWSCSDAHALGTEPLCQRPHNVAPQPMFHLLPKLLCVMDVLHRGIKGLVDVVEPRRQVRHPPRGMRQQPENHRAHLGQMVAHGRQKPSHIELDNIPRPGVPSVNINQKKREEVLLKYPEMSISDVERHAVGRPVVIRFPRR